MESVKPFITRDQSYLNYRCISCWAHASEWPSGPPRIDGDGKRRSRPMIIHVEHKDGCAFRAAWLKRYPRWPEGGYVYRGPAS